MSNIAGAIELEGSSAEALLFSNNSNSSNRGGGAAAPATIAPLWNLGLFAQHEWAFFIDTILVYVYQSVWSARLLRKSNQMRWSIVFRATLIECWIIWGPPALHCTYYSVPYESHYVIKNYSWKKGAASYLEVCFLTCNHFRPRKMKFARSKFQVDPIWFDISQTLDMILYNVMCKYISIKQWDQG